MQLNALIKNAVLVSCLVLSVGCSKEDNNSTPPKQNKVVNLVLEEENGLNNIGTKIPFNVDDIKKQLTGYVITEEKSECEEGMCNYINIGYNKNIPVVIEGAGGAYHTIKVGSYDVIPRVQGRIGDSFDGFIFSTDEAVYKEYCKPGMETYSGTIICLTRTADRSKTTHISHVFAGEYNGPDGELPPLDKVQNFKIVSTLWQKK
ncbi:DUF1131 family protein [Spartinivicinus ruber]|uniref:DUF1131 family protein n=1 Tax=Spartinivicinus ruber TaxID=2683272 RepID=UPI0013D671F3|nr:DUF1131 family protein [Spartinivicinus ruber]